MHSWPIRNLSVLPAVLMMAATCLSVHAAQSDRSPVTREQPGAITPGSPAGSRPPTVAGRPLQEVLNSKAYIERLTTYLIGYETWIGICTDAEPEQRLRTLMITEPVRLPGADRADGPQWLEVISVKGCNKTYKRLIYATYHDGKPVFHAQLPGSTKTRPVLQHRTLMALRDLETDRAHRAGCDRAHRARVLAAHLEDGWDGEGDTEWRETWVVHSCRGVDNVPVRFAPDGKGEITFSFDAAR
ncbi:MAG: hypothetical protein ACR2PM_19730 [Hyphomicrobiales bacterium]